MMWTNILLILAVLIIVAMAEAMRATLLLALQKQKNMLPTCYCPYQRLTESIVIIAKSRRKMAIVIIRRRHSLKNVAYPLGKAQILSNNMYQLYEVVMICQPMKASWVEENERMRLELTTWKRRSGIRAKIRLELQQIINWYD